MKHLQVIGLTLLLSSAGQVNSAGQQARYLGYTTLAKILFRDVSNPLWHNDVVCLAIDQSLLVGVKRVWGGVASKLRKIRAGSTVSARYNDTELWVTWPSGIEDYYNRAESNQTAADACKMLAAAQLR